MSEKGILEGNKLIAVFDGGIYSKYATAWGFGKAEIRPLKDYPDAVWAERWEKELKYHSSWDWLMPVVEKIDSLDCVDSGDGGVSISGFDGTTIWLKESPFIHKVSSTRIESCWLAVIEFIKWYNQNKND